MSVITLLIASFGGFVLNLTNLPLAWLLGAMLSIAACSQKFKTLHIAHPLRSGATAILGTVVGLLVSSEILDLLVQYAPSIALMLLFQLLLMGAGTYFLLRRTSTDHTSAFLASYPGAVSQITAISLDQKCDSQLVAINHTTRLFFVIAFLPIIVNLFTEQQVNTVPSLAPSHFGIEPVGNYIWPLVIAATGYFLGKISRIMTPSLFGPMILAALLTVTNIIPELNIGEWLIPIAQIVIGAAVGLRFREMNAGKWKKMLYNHLPYAMVLLCLTVIAALCVHLLLGLPLNTSLLIMAPGGLSEIVLIAIALDIDPVLVTAHHVIRSLFGFIFIPWVLKRYSTD